MPVIFVRSATFQHFQQVFNGPRPVFSGSCSCAGRACVEAPLCRTPVSYTHLDYSQVDGVIHSSLHTYVKAEVGDIVACVEDLSLIHI